MKVLMISTEKLPVPPVRGGAIQTYISGIAPLLSRKHDLTILGTSDPGLPEREKKGKIRYVRVEGGYLDVYKREVVKYVKKHRKKFDVIHIFNRPRLVLPVHKAAPRARIILSMHNDMFDPEKLDPKEAKQVLKKVEKVVTISDYVGRRIRELHKAKPSKFRTIYSGVDLQRFTPWDQSKKALRIRKKLRRQYGLGSKKVILYVGRISPKKGADILVRAMNELKKRHPDIALVVVGGRWFSDDRVSDYTAYVRALAKRSSVPIITTGYVSGDKIHEWFWAGDVFVCTSLWQEPLARVHFEAMASGLPFITTKRGGNPEVVEKRNGMVVDRPEDPKAFANALSKLLKDKSKRRQMGRKGRSLAEKKYGWKRVAKEVGSVWKAGPSKR
ncbi:spore coat protein SA [Melghirimyces profundicolus]|uniref:Spore coat protein SA n=1 Tax=Melghirimyces profundicolus TaxID=1242148 RepID=A0A2T6AY21_9BACL|nr:glycosyltransferase family 4 protein [Melghirimyces profundicolus]PTX48714.1 spore coat protein SA [Melghirimyces profundicolus]